MSGMLKEFYTFCPFTSFSPRAVSFQISCYVRKIYNKRLFRFSLSGSKKYPNWCSTWPWQGQLEPCPEFLDLRLRVLLLAEFTSFKSLQHLATCILATWLKPLCRKRGEWAWHMERSEAKRQWKKPDALGPESRCDKRSWPFTSHGCQLFQTFH